MLCMVLYIYACGLMKCSLITISEKLTENVNTSNGLDYHFSPPNQNSIKDIFQNNMRFCATLVQVTENTPLPT